LWLAAFSCALRRPPTSPLFPYTTLFRSGPRPGRLRGLGQGDRVAIPGRDPLGFRHPRVQQLRRLSGRRAARSEEGAFVIDGPVRSEEHTSELQSRENLVCRLLLEKKKET